MKSFGKFNSKLPSQPVQVERRAPFVRDRTYENSPGVKEALAAIDTRAPIILVTGRAGTGKTTLIQYLRNRPGGEFQAVVAPTGVAAMNAGAQTIHSFFHFPSVLLDRKNLPEGRRFGTLYQRMKRLVIDEISMVRADLLDAIDARLKEIRKTSAPFGGVQIVMVGDFLQLPPVVDEEHRPLLNALGYKSQFAFSAHALQDDDVAVVSLDEVHRQEEKEFIDLLARVRMGEDSAEVARVLNERCHRPHRSGVTPLLLTPTRAAADRYNAQGLAALPGISRSFRARSRASWNRQRPAAVPKLGSARWRTRDDDQERYAAKMDQRLVRNRVASSEGFVYVKFDRSGEASGRTGVLDEDSPSVEQRRLSDRQRNHRFLQTTAAATGLGDHDP